MHATSRGRVHRPPFANERRIWGWASRQGTAKLRWRGGGNTPGTIEGAEMNMYLPTVQVYVQLLTGPLQVTCNQIFLMSLVRVERDGEKGGDGDQD